jgi:hypothetical protein
MRQSPAPSVTKTVDSPLFFLKTKLFVTARKPAAMCRPKEAAVRGSQTIERTVFMSDTCDIMAAYQNHQKVLAEANAINKTAVFDALAAAGIATVNVTFDGEGDSGQIEGIAADDSPNIPQVQIELQKTSWGTGRLESVQSPLRDAIEQLCYDFLEQQQDGWENNDGAFGEFIFNVARRSIELEFNARFSDSALFNYSF